MNLADEMYQEEILELYRAPHNHGSIKNAGIHYRDYNPVCGDEIDLFIKEDKGTIADAKFTGRGCAISQAAASKLTDFMKGKKLSQISKTSNEKMLELLGAKVSHLRIKCALLALKAAQKGILISKGRKARRN
jgi:nitrogen fixation protein NifU and related proteins